MNKKLLLITLMFLIVLPIVFGVDTQFYEAYIGDEELIVPVSEVGDLELNDYFTMSPLSTPDKSSSIFNGYDITIHNRKVRTYQKTTGITFFSGCVIFGFWKHKKIKEEAIQDLEDDEDDEDDEEAKKDKKDKKEKEEDDEDDS